MVDTNGAIDEGQVTSRLPSGKYILIALFIALLVMDLYAKVPQVPFMLYW